MIYIGLIDIFIFPETFIPPVIVMIDLPALPTVVTFYAKMVVPFSCQCAVAVIGFKHTLGQGNACRYPGSVHFLDRQIFIFLDIMFTSLRLRFDCGFARC